MNIKDKLLELIVYYQCSRQTGHTTGMVNGIKNTDRCIVLTHNKQMGKLVKEMVKEPKKDQTFASVESFLPLRGHRKPLFIDNTALQELFAASLKEIEFLEGQIAYYEKQSRRY